MARPGFVPLAVIGPTGASRRHERRHQQKETPRDGGLDGNDELRGTDHLRYRGGGRNVAKVKSASPPATEWSILIMAYSASGWLCDAEVRHRDLLEQVW